MKDLLIKYDLCVYLYISKLLKFTYYANSLHIAYRYSVVEKYKLDDQCYVTLISLIFQSKNIV